MLAVNYDIIWIGDLRFPGGTSTAISEEVTASAAAGYRCGLIPMRSSILSFPHPINPKIRRLIDHGIADLIDPRSAVACRLCCLYHPASFGHFPIRPPKIEAGVKLLVTTHPPFDGQGISAYDTEAIDRNVQELLGGEVLWAPVGPAVRAQFATMVTPPDLLDIDWLGIIDHDAWRLPEQTALTGRPIIGRHSRPDPSKWPDTRDDILTVYPASPEVDVKILGGGPFLHDLMAPMPANWRVYDFNQMTPQDFLQQIGVFVYFHHSNWVEAFGYSILEAAAAGLPTVLPPPFEPLFGDAAIYANPENALACVQRFYGDAAHYREQKRKASDIVAQRFGHQAQAQRLQNLIGKPMPSRVLPAVKPKRQRRRILFMSSNGVGMGHLTRLLAIARRLPPTIDVVFVTLSQAAHLVQDFGYPFEYLPFHRYLRCDVQTWNHYLRKDLTERFAFYQPDAVIFDGNVLYDGLIRALMAIPDCPFAWSRRAMWTRNSGAPHIQRQRYADVVIEPRDFAGDMDRGLTVENRQKTRLVEPILLLDQDDLLDRTTAREALGLDPGRPACLLQLGAGAQLQAGTMETRLLRYLADQPGWQVVWMDSPVSPRGVILPDGIERRTVYPIARYYNAFDGAVSAAGYNAYHECLTHGLPTLFIPNEHPMMDDQLARAIHADLHGRGLCLRRQDHYRVESVAARLLDPAEQAAMRARCHALASPNGAVEAAVILEELVYGCRADLDHADDIVAALRGFGPPV